MNKDYITLDKAYQILNQKLFKSSLPECIITLQRKKGANGYFHATRFENKKDKEYIRDEIAMNPDHFDRKDEEVLSTLAHEMVHCWQNHFGENQSRNTYHNKEWANKMESIGLIPSDTGTEGGKRTGQKITHYINETGQFNKIITSLLETHKIEWKSKIEIKESKKTSNSKTKYICPRCDQKAWAKESANLMCGECKMKMQTEEGYKHIKQLEYFV